MMFHIHNGELRHSSFKNKLALPVMSYNLHVFGPVGDSNTAITD